MGDITANWEGANCNDYPGDGFYPMRGSAQLAVRWAKSVCNGTDGKHEACPFKDRCGEHALTKPERFGVWGGMSERDRNKERKRRDTERRAMEQALTTEEIVGGQGGEVRQ